MKYLLLLMLVVTSSCAKKEGRYIQCAPFIKIGDDGHRINGFWDLGADRETRVENCDEIVVK
mgnify:FL=1